MAQWVKCLPQTWGSEFGSPAYMERSGELVDTCNPARRVGEEVKNQRHMCPGGLSTVSSGVTLSQNVRWKATKEGRQHGQLSLHTLEQALHIYTHPYTKLTKFKRNECVDLWQTITAVPQLWQKLIHFPHLHGIFFLYSASPLTHKSSLGIYFIMLV